MCSIPQQSLNAARQWPCICSTLCSLSLGRRYQHQFSRFLCKRLLACTIWRRVIITVVLAFPLTFSAVPCQRHGLACRMAMDAPMRVDAGELRSRAVTISCVAPPCCSTALQLDQTRVARLAIPQLHFLVLFPLFLWPNYEVLSAIMPYHGF